MAPSMERVLVKAFGAKDAHATVTATEAVTPHYHRVEVDLGDLFTRHPWFPTMWLRFWFDNAGKPHQRAFTLVDHTPGTTRAWLEFALHDGIAADWARNAKPGDELQASLLGTKLPWKGEAPRFGSSWERTVLVGGMACLPAINALLELWPDAAIHVVLESTHDDDRDVPLALGAHHEVTWVAPGTDICSIAESLVAPNTRYWITTEAAVTRDVVKTLRREYDVPKDAIYSQAYWNLSRG